MKQIERDFMFTSNSKPMATRNQDYRWKEDEPKAKWWHYIVMVVGVLFLSSVESIIDILLSWFGW